MSTQNNRITIVNLDFDLIKNALIAFMQGQSTFTDYNFLAAGLQQLIDILSYNTHYGAYYLNMLSNEIGISTALVRDNINRLAKMLNYTPHSATSPTAFVNLTVTPTATQINTAPATITIPRFTAFQSQIVNGSNFTYNTMDAYTATLVGGSYIFSNVAIQEGEVVNYTYAADVSNPQNIFNIPNANIDTSTLVVLVTENTPAPPTQYAYTYCTDVSLLTGTSRVYFLDGSYANTYNLYFGDGILGKAPISGDAVNITYLVTNGDASNLANNFTIMSPIGIYSNVVVQAASAADGGGGSESDTSVAFNAPLSYTTQERAVTISDYSFLLKRDYANISSLNMWGGDQNIPPVYGQIFLSIVPKYGTYLTNLQKQTVTNILKTYNMPTVIPQIVDPDYTYLLFNLDVNYNPNATTLTSQQLITAIQSTIASYAATQLGQFQSTYRESSLNSAIQDADPSILGSDVEIFLQKRFFPLLGQSATYTLNYYTALHQGGLNEKLYSSPAITLFDSFGNPQTCFIEENINTYQGINSIGVSTPGTNFTSQPDVIIDGDGVGASAHAIIINGGVAQVVLDQQGEGYSFATAQIVGGGGYGAVILPILTSQVGILDTYYYTNSNKFIINTNQGNVDHINGIVTITNFAPITISNANPTDQLTINIKPQNNIILPVRNSVLTFDPTDPNAININLIPQVI